MNSTNNTIANVVANQTNNSDTIYLDQGTYNHTHLNGSNGISINKNLTIIGQGSGQTIIDAQNLGRIFNIISNGTLTLINLTLIHGNTTSMGGTIYNQGTLTLNNCILTENNANSYGGAIYCHYNTTMNIYNSNFTNNLGNYGGAIYSNTGTLFNIINSIFINNTVNRGGGAIYTQDNQGTYNRSNISNSKFINNRANLGGACSINGKTNFTINNSTFINNTATSNGGAIEDFFNTNFRIINSTFENNTATQNGGAIYSYSITNIENSDFTNNKANNGGAIYSEYDMSVNNSHFINNIANITGGGIYNNGIMLVSRNTMTGNSALLGNMIYNNGNMGILNLTYLNNSTILVNNNTYVSVYATLTDDMRNTVTGQIISFYINGTFVANIESIEGYANITHLVNHEKGLVSVTGDYQGHDQFEINIHNGQLQILNNTTVIGNINLEKDEYWVNETVKGIIKVINTGSDIAYDIIVKVNLPHEFTLGNNSVIVSHGYYDPNDNIWYIGNLTPGEEATMNFTGKFTETGTYTIDIITSGTNFSNTTDTSTALIKQNTTPPTPNPENDNKTINILKTHAVMKETGTPINLILLVLLSALGVIIHRKQINQ